MPKGFVQFGRPIVLDSGGTITAWYPDPDNENRNWIIEVTHDDTVVDSREVSLGPGHGPNIDDVLRLEQTTVELEEEYGQEC